MDYLLICTVSFTAAALTLYSGFGLGTLLMPVFAVFFPVEIAVALTAVVHLLNNLFKASLFFKFADRSILFHFGLPAVFAAFFGARVLVKLSDLKPIFEYTLFDKAFAVTPIKMTIGFLIICFVLIDSIPKIRSLELPKRFLPWGGFLSGFFGGISGNQGALRSAFLIKCGLTKEAFIGTGVVIACLVDISRLSVYSVSFAPSGFNHHFLILTAATAAAFFGTWIANRLLKKMTIELIHIFIGFLLVLIGIGLASGII